MKRKCLNFMLLGVFAFALSMSFVGCSDYDDDIKNLQGQIDANKKVLEDLENTIKSGGMIQSVTSNANGIEIKMTNGTSYSVTNGKDGNDGTPGSVVSVGENGNWYIDNTDTGIPARGQDGEGGTSGTPGKDGIYYYPGTEKTGENPNYPYWVKVDSEGNETVTTDQWLVAADGALSAVVSDGYVTLFGIEGYTQGYIISMNSACLSSLQFVPEWIDNGVATQGFYYINRITTPITTVYNSEPDMVFRYNPTSANLTGINWSFVNRTAIVTRAAGDKNDLLTIVGEPVIENNSLKFSVKGDASKRQENISTGGDKEDIAYLKANALEDLNKPQGARMDILSDYIKIRFAGLTAYIGDTVQMLRATAPVSYPTYDYYTSLTALKATASNVFNHAIAYDGGTYDLHDYVFASAGSASLTREMLGKLGFKGYDYKFTSISYTPSDGTDQSAFVDLNQATGTFTIKMGTAAIDRTPIFQADLLAPSGDVIARHYIKFKITNRIVNPIDEVIIDAGNIPYMDLYAAAPAYKSRLSMGWLQMNQEVYQALGLSHDQFRANYNWNTAILETADGHAPINTFDITTGKGDWGARIISTNAPNVDTHAFEITVDPRTQFGAHEWTLTFTAVDPTLYPAVTVRLKFNLVAPAHPEFEPNYVVGGIATTKGKLIGGFYEMQTTLAESFKVPSMNSFKTNVVDIIANHANAAWTTQQQYFAYVNGYPTGAEFTARAIETPSATASNGAIDVPVDYVNDFVNQDIKLTTPLNGDAWTYDVKLKSVYVNNEVIQTPWKILFENPLSATMKPIVLATEEEPSMEDLADLLTVRLGTIKIYENGVANGNYWNTYQVPAINAMGWNVVRTSFTNATTLYLQNTTEIVWDNQGTSLQTDVTSEKVRLVISTPYAVKTSDFPVTLKKTVGFTGN